MEISPTILIIAGFIIMVLGIGAGMLLSSFNEEGDAEEGSAELAPPGGRKGRYTPLARLWRERGAVTLLVEMDGKTFLRADAMSEAQREQLERAARELRAWLGMGLASTANEPDAGQPASTPPAAAPVSDAVRPAPDLSVAAPATAVPASRPVPSRPVPTIEPVVVPAVGPKSIVNQIEDVLQDMIAGTALERQGLHLMEDPIRGVLVHFGGMQYEGIESMPEGEAKNAIRAAVAEWEKTR
jgi:hypothetical protein